ncbi:MAG: PIN domain-containing protein [Anaerolineae bacterium]|nr:PIN domain-containing protein [Anaerolineae bacterium]
MFTIDASVHINALNSRESGSAESQAFLERVHRHPFPVFSPTLLLVEISAVLARVFDDSERGISLARAVYALPGQIWVPLDDALAEEAARLGAKYRLRGADAVYAAVAHRHRATLVTLDRQQLERLPPVLTVRRPLEALEHLNASDRLSVGWKETSKSGSTCARSYCLTRRRTHVRLCLL